MKPGDLASQLGLTPDAINKIERGERGLNVAQLVHLSQIFDVSLERLVYVRGVKPRIIPFLKTVITG